MTDDLLIKLKKGQKAFATFCHRRVFKKNRNVIIMITGDPGTGKTLSAFRLGKELDSEFTKEFIRQDASEILDIFEMIAKDKKRYTGRVIIFEETQENMHRTKAITVESTSIVSLFAKFRYLNNILIMTTPRQGHLNKDIIDYVDIHLSTERIFQERKICRLKAKFGKYSESQKKMYWRFLKVEYPGEPVLKLKYVDCYLPDKDLIDVYDSKKDEFFLESVARDRSRIRRKYGTLVPKKTYPHTCPFCKYEYNARVENPIKCPSCQKKLSHTTTT